MWWRPSRRALIRGASPPQLAQVLATETFTHTTEMLPVTLKCSVTSDNQYRFSAASAPGPGGQHKQSVQFQVVRPLTVWGRLHVFGRQPVAVVFGQHGRVRLFCRLIGSILAPDPVADGELRSGAGGRHVSVVELEFTCGPGERGTPRRAPPGRRPAAARRWQGLARCAGAECRYRPWGRRVRGHRSCCWLLVGCFVAGGCSRPWD